MKKIIILLAIMSLPVILRAQYTITTNWTYIKLENAGMATTILFNKDIKFAYGSRTFFFADKLSTGTWEYSIKYSEISNYNGISKTNQKFPTAEEIRTEIIKLLSIAKHDYPAVVEPLRRYDTTNYNDREALTTFDISLRPLFKKTTVKEQLSTFIGGTHLGFILTPQFMYGQKDSLIIDEWPFILTKDVECLPVGTIVIFQDTISGKLVWAVGRLRMDTLMYPQVIYVNGCNIPLDNAWYRRIYVIYPWEVNYQHRNFFNQPGGVQYPQNGTASWLEDRHSRPMLPTFYAIQWDYRLFIPLDSLAYQDDRQPFANNVVGVENTKEYCLISPFYSCFMNYAMSNKMSIEKAWELVSGLYSHSWVAESGIISSPDLEYPLLPLKMFSDLSYPFYVYYFKRYTNPLDGNISVWNDPSQNWIPTSDFIDVTVFDDVFVRFENEQLNPEGILTNRPIAEP